MGGTLGGGAILHVDFKCFVCKERKQDVRVVPGDPTLYACLNCVPAGQEQTAVLQHRIKQLRRDASCHRAQYEAACAEIERLQGELDSLPETAVGEVSWRMSVSEYDPLVWTPLWGAEQEGEG